MKGHAASCPRCVRTSRHSVLDADVAVIRRQVHDLAVEYERIRATMRPSDSRTRRMEVVLTKMRTLAFAAYPLLDQLTNSSSAGERLAAVAILEVRPSQAYLNLEFRGTSSVSLVLRLPRSLATTQSLAAA
jgi:hypothetical protein